MEPDLDRILAAAEEEEEQPPVEEEQDEPSPVQQPRSALSPFSQQQPEDYLPALNPAQRLAVTFPATGGLQILAGPGSGKTKVLTTRVAYLLQKYSIEPESMVVVTFTNKAANEMKARLRLLVGGATVSKILMGTFHSVCVRYLRKYGPLIGLPSNFLIADRDDCLAIIKRGMDAANFSSYNRTVAEAVKKGLKAPVICEVISKCKARNISWQQYRAGERELKHGPEHSVRTEVYADVFKFYEEELRKGNACDFDDLLTFGLKLVDKHPHVIARVRTVLIDEMQDTNNVQWQFVKCLAKGSGSLTVVGDPDQSIYGWRNAEVGNLEAMKRSFAPVKQIFLEENYRSTGAILGAAIAVVQQGTSRCHYTSRIQKTLKATHPAGSSVVLHSALNAFEEADYIAGQIKMLIAHTGGQIHFGDIAILIRYGALSRLIETALQKASIPSRMIGSKFFDRQEVKDILSYLQLIDNPNFSPAFARVVNSPKRGMGDKTVKEILAIADQKNISPFEVAVMLANGSGLVTTTVTQKTALRKFVKVVRELRTLADEGGSVPDIIDQLCFKVDYLEHLKRMHGPDAQDRTENLRELQAFAATVVIENPEGLGDPVLDAALDVDVIMGAKPPGKEDEGRGLDDSGFEEDLLPPSSQAVAVINSPLRTFLAVSMLATDTESEAAKDDLVDKKVTITTCHSAKGLEWPVVFVPACESGIYPFYRADTPEQHDEERRLLYVAITRAQVFCTISYADERMSGARVKDAMLSPFVSTASKAYPTLFVPALQLITAETRADISKVLSRPPVAEAVVATMVEKYVAALPPPRPVYGYKNNSNGTGSYHQGAGAVPQVERKPMAIPANAGFKSALSVHKAAPLLPLSAANNTRSIPSKASVKAPVKAPVKATTTTNGQPKLNFATDMRRTASAEGTAMRRTASTERILSFSQPGALQRLKSEGSLGDASPPSSYSNVALSSQASSSSSPPPSSSFAQAAPYVVHSGPYTAPRPLRRQAPPAPPSSAPYYARCAPNDSPRPQDGYQSGYAGSSSQGPYLPTPPSAQTYVQHASYGTPGLEERHNGLAPVYGLPPTSSQGSYPPPPPSAPYYGQPMPYSAPRPQDRYDYLPVPGYASAPPSSTQVWSSFAPPPASSGPHVQAAPFVGQRPIEQRPAAIPFFSDNSAPQQVISVNSASYSTPSVLAPVYHQHPPLPSSHPSQLPSIDSYAQSNRQVPPFAPSTSSQSMRPLQTTSHILSYSSRLPPPPKTSGKGSLNLPETRASLIDDAVLVNPPMPGPPKDWLGTFVANEVVALAAMSGTGSGQGGSAKKVAAKGKGKGKAVEVIDLVSSDSGVPYQPEKPRASAETVVELVDVAPVGKEVRGVDEEHPISTEVEGSDAPANALRPSRSVKRAPGAFVAPAVLKKAKK